MTTERNYSQAMGTQRLQEEHNKNSGYEVRAIVKLSIEMRLAFDQSLVSRLESFIG